MTLAKRAASAGAVIVMVSSGFEIRDWELVSGVCLPNNGSAIGHLEKWAASVINKVSTLFNMGAYIGAWAVKR